VTLRVTGQVKGSSVGHGVTSTYGRATTGTHFPYTALFRSGVWTYTLDNAGHQNLAAGETQHETFTVTVTDDQGATTTQDVAITISRTSKPLVITSDPQSCAAR